MYKLGIKEQSVEIPLLHSSKRYRKIRSKKTTEPVESARVKNSPNFIVFCSIYFKIYRKRYTSGSRIVLYILWGGIKNEKRKIQDEQIGNDADPFVTGLEKPDEHWVSYLLRSGDVFHLNYWLNYINTNFINNYLFGRQLSQDHIMIVTVSAHYINRSRQGQLLTKLAASHG